MLQPKLDSLDIKILAALRTYGPRNFAEVARRTKISPTTLQYRLKSLSSHFSLIFLTNIYHVNLGLKKIVIVVEAQPGREELLLNCLKVNGFWIYLAPIYGIIQGYLGVYTIPEDHIAKFEQFLNELKDIDVARSVRYVWTTSLQKVNLVGTWFDFDSEVWAFQWENWVNEILGKSTELPYTLKDPDQFPILADEIDMFILKELEKNAVISFSELAKRLGITPPAVRHRYRKLLKLNLIENFDIRLYPFQSMPTENFYFVFDFEHQEAYAKFATSLLDKPFVVSLGKVLGQSSMIAFLYIPLQEFRRFINALSKLRAIGWLQNYFYVHMDINKDQKQTFPYEYFKQGSWIYDHNEQIKTIRTLSKQSLEL